jgi:hypothetical protein
VADRSRPVDRIIDRIASFNVTTLMTLVALGVVLRVFLLGATAGSNDIFSWERFGRQINDWGVLAEYRNVPRFNHPPIMGLWAQLAVRIADSRSIPFGIVFKLLPVASDIVAIWLLWRLAGRQGGELHAWRAAAIFATSLVSIVITGHHGNTDSVCAMLSLVAAILVADGSKPFVAGLALAAAINVKLIPIVLLPALAPLLADKRAAMRFGAGLGIGLVPFLPAVVLAADAFYRNAVAYQPRSGWWGIHFLLTSLSDLPRVGAWFGLMDDRYTQVGRYVIMAASLALGFWARWFMRSAIETAALALAMFLLLAPALGMQYLVIVVPLLVLTDLRRAAVWSLVAGIFLIAVYLYYQHGWFPYRSRHHGPLPTSIRLVGLCAWLLLAEFVISRLGRRSTVAASIAVP